MIVRAIKIICRVMRVVIFGQVSKSGAKSDHKFDIVCTVHRSQSCKQTNKTHFLYVFILQFLYSSTCFERPFRSSSGVHDLLYLQLCTDRANVSVDAYKNCKINTYRKCILLVCVYNRPQILTTSVCLSA